MCGAKIISTEQKLITKAHMENVTLHGAGGAETTRGDARPGYVGGELWGADCTGAGSGHHLISVAAGGAKSKLSKFLMPGDSGASFLERGEAESFGVGSCADKSGSTFELIQLQSILSELRKEQVRIDFLSGHIMKVDDAEMSLLSLDAIHAALFPEWVANQVERRTRMQLSVDYFNKLSSGSSAIFKIPCALTNLDEHKYATWKRAINKLMESMYWCLQKESQMVNGRIEQPKLNPKEDSSLGLQQQQPLLKSKFGGTQRYQQPESDSSDGTLPKSAKSKYKARKSYGAVVKRQVEFVEISDSSSDSEVDGFSSDASVVVTRSSRRRYFPKDVVTPGVFDINGTQPLKGFLDDYERYFWTKYEGTERDCTKELSRFISGEIREAYDALGGSRLKYQDMKPALLQWYKSQSVGRTHKYKLELKNIVMKPGESYKLYCMRIQEVANRAYPSDYRECLKQMKRRLTLTVPGWFSRSIEKKEELKVMLNMGKKVTWKEIMEIAERHDRKQRKAQLYNDSDEEEELKSRMEQLRCSMMSAEGKVHSDKGSSMNESSSRAPEDEIGGSSVQCHYCGRVGHIEPNCWFKSGACTVCGGFSHRYRECPKFSAIPKEFSPRCSHCGGDHLGKDCHRRQRVSRGRGRGSFARGNLN